MPVPNTFANATATIPLSQLDANFATTITLGNTAIQLGNTVSTLNNMTLANVTVTSGNVTLTNVTVTTANVTNATITTANVTTANIATEVVTTSQTLSYGTANGIVYLNGSKVSTTGASLTFDGTNFATTGSVTSAGASNSGNLAFTGTGNRITGDFSNATQSSRVVFQTSTTNGFTGLEAAPNGTSNTVLWTLSNANDVTNASTFQYYIDSTVTKLDSGKRGTGSYLPMTFYTGGSERMRVDTSGNVGIGTTSPTSYGSSKFAVVGGEMGISDTSDARLYLYNGTTRAALFFASATRTQLEAIGGTPLTLWADAAERARIDSSGNLLVGTTSAAADAVGARLLASNQIQASKSGDWSFRMGRTTSSGIITEIYYNTSRVGDIATNGSNTTYNSASDYRLKENVQPMANALSKVAALKPVTFTWKSTGTNDEGFLAHELQMVVPQAVRGEKDEVDADGEPVYQSIDTSVLVATLTAALQELKAELDATKAEVAALKGA
jgi:hypothetical protein